MILATSASTETIVAASSPPGRSPRGLIRITGPDAVTILDALATPHEPQDRWPARQLTRARLNVPPLPVLVAVFPGPHSYTGQHTVELQLPGHPALLDRVIHQIIGAGARLAEPGEFTFRAFTAGKLDLTQAEGIAATIAATSDSQLQAAGMLREGQLGRFAAELVDQLGTQLALVEAGIDFTDQEDVVPITPGELLTQLQRLTAQLDQLLSRSRSWGTLETLPRVVLVGPPSAGKSTLFNALLGKQRAVISATPGTTRDVLSEPLALTTATGQAVEVMLVDIAGLDEPRQLLDAEVQNAARQAIRQADLVLLVQAVDQTTSLAAAVPPSVPILHVRSKADRLPKWPEPASGQFVVSVMTHRGLDELRQGITERVGDRGVSVGSQMLALQPRHEHALQVARTALQQACELLLPQRDAAALGAMELVAGCMREALDELAGLGGQLTPDDVIGRIFATFCIGK